jgi:acyl-CoA reductase-like NAD-dependent aldehyde dehydrogenase
MAIKRIYVPTRRRNEFVDAFSKVTDFIVVGDGLELSVTTGLAQSTVGRPMAVSSRVIR